MPSTIHAGHAIAPIVECPECLASREREVELLLESLLNLIAKRERKTTQQVRREFKTINLDTVQARLAIIAKNDARIRNAR